MGIDEVLVAKTTCGPAKFVQAPKNLKFQRFVFRGRFNDKIHSGHVFQVDTGLNSFQNGRLFFGAQFALFDIARQNSVDGCQTALDKFRFDIVHDDRQSARGSHLGDAASHLSSADDTECLDSHITPLDVFKSLHRSTQITH